MTDADKVKTLLAAYHAAYRVAQRVADAAAADAYDAADAAWKAYQTAMKEKGGKP